MSNCNIKVIGVGGGGCNAVDHMIEFGVQSAQFIAINTDAQQLVDCKAEFRLQIGDSLTKGQGSGADPAVGRAAAENSKTAIAKLIEGADMVFVTAGMGGGTGTGAAPIVAKIAKDQKILTVGVVTTPFGLEGERRMQNARQGIDNLIKVVDTLLIIPNEKLASILPEDASWDESFRYADDTLRQAIQGVTDLIATKCLINLDFADVCTVMRDKGLAHIGVGMGEGENRVLRAIQQAVNSPLLDTTIDNATGVIINIRGGPDLKLHEVRQSVDLVRQVVAKDALIIFGGGTEPALEGRILATVIATGFSVPSHLSFINTRNIPKREPQPRTQLGAPAAPVDPTGGPYAPGGSPAPVPPRPKPSVDLPETRVDADLGDFPPWLRSRLGK